MEVKILEKELKEVSVLKTAMMISVVLYHSCLFFSGSWVKFTTPVYSATYLTYLIDILKSFHIQTFTFTSGFLFFYLKSIGKYKNTKTDLLNKAKRLILPLITTIIVWIIPFYIYYNGFDFRTILHKFVLLEGPAQLWFLPMLFWIFVIFNIAYDKIKFSIKDLIIIFLLTNLIGGILLKLNLNYCNIAKAIQFSCYFYLGGFIFKNKDKFTKKKMIPIYCVTLALIYIYIYIYKIAGFGGFKYISYIIEPTLSCLEATCLYFIFDYLVNKRNINTDNRIYKLFSENSFGIYLFHQQIISVTITIFNGVVHPVIQCLLSFVISTSVSLVMTLILKKNKVTKKLFGI